MFFFGWIGPQVLALAGNLSDRVYTDAIFLFFTLFLGTIV